MVWVGLGGMGGIRGYGWDKGVWVGLGGYGWD